MNWKTGNPGLRARLILLGILAIFILTAGALYVGLRRTGRMERVEIPATNLADTNKVSSASPTEVGIEPHAKNSRSANANTATHGSSFAGIEDLLSDGTASTNKASQRTVPKNDAKVDRQLRLPPPASLPNGTELVPGSSRQGLGTLSIENGNNSDAVVKLVDAMNTETTVRCVYIRGNSSVQLTGIPPGDCRVMFTLGTDWDRVQMEFRRDPVYEEFVDNLLYREVEETDSILYPTFRLTLHKVARGNAPSRSISRGRFGIAIPEPQR